MRIRYRISKEITLDVTRQIYLVSLVWSSNYMIHKDCGPAIVYTDGDYAYYKHGIAGEAKLASTTIR